ncbi:pimeloyl-ACP methyl ester carboxylesterase [Anaerobacterium chartisolvens]|uniref:Pimeloyl-ACP methyl ester carboxylesterase n=1 Tax=Anaerobacterium chartisolvens TaxID=1297424 RepID=A0A369BKG5_9FIRM|nr:alpha/beta hydrolase [Anaerobacterium chartisolvens]RCX21098.1 pimeloyl-ACP methyl ester carboxylesterase [Anaerobacterium chartisolvens]
MIQTIAFFILIILSVIAFVGVVILSAYRAIAHIRKKTNPKQIIRLKKTAIFLAVAVILNIGLVTLSQFTASTPRIVNENGNTPANSIAELTELELNGRKQWISLRGWDKSKPVLLFLAGGPGGTQMAAVRHELVELEKHFVVVNWDQPGSGKSYYAEKTQNITVDTYVQDGHALTEYLKERFSQEKIYLVGESWGSALGIFLVDKSPQSYHAIIGTGQMIDFAETERMDYAKAMEIAKNNGDTALIEQLTANGEPPYYGKDVTWRSAAYINYLSAYMASNPGIQNPGYNTFRDIGSSEYGLLDKINYARGVINTFGHVYQQLYDIDMRTDYTKLNVPVYFFLGRYDINAPTVLVEEYERVLNAPDKGIVWFEHSGHSPWINERAKFAKEVLSCFLENKTQE